MRHVRETIAAMEKQSVLHSPNVCLYLVTSGTQHAMSMRSVVLSSVACQPLQFFPLYIIIGTIFEERLLNIKCVL